MAHARDAKGPPAGRKDSASPNIQDVFLNHARREKLPVLIRFMDGGELDGRIKNFDRFALIVEHQGADLMIFKHAIASIRSTRAIANYYASHES
jgi:host factor-I protein